MQNYTRSSKPSKFRVAVIGGGPGGLFTAWHLGAKAGDSCEITIYEGDSRVGGKIVTSQFPGVGPYEAGVAEIYDYSRLGPDPLRDMIVNELGLDVKYLQGGPCVVAGKIVQTVDDLAPLFGEPARDEAKAFLERCIGLMSTESYYLSVAQSDNTHPWARISGEALLNCEITHDIARRYVRAMAHSDLAAIPYQTNGLTFLKNALMDADGYMDILSVVGGNDQIVTRLVDQLDANIRVNCQVTGVRPLDDGTYAVEFSSSGVAETAIADYVVIALPISALATIHWWSEALQEAVDRHCRYFDRPGHYLRATLLFKRPFWREHLSADWWMLDSFDGCCVYDESSRHDYSCYGALAFLMAGNAALAMNNYSDERIEQMCLDALPPELAEARDLIVDRRIHRWMASVNAIPGGPTVRPRAENHRPDPKRLPGVLMVGDYMFDATLNGVLDSADAATDVLLAEILRRRRVSEPARAEAADIETVLEGLFPVETLRHILETTWRLGQGAKILHVGAMSGRMLARLRELGYDAQGVEFDFDMWSARKTDSGSYNRHCYFDRLPFANDAFDVVVETGLCRVAPNLIEKAVKEIRRVARRGVVLGSVTTDLPIDLIERYHLLDGVEILGSRWDWSERLYSVGFVHALTDTFQLDQAWKKVQSAGAGPDQWLEDAESLLYCVYQPAPADAQSAEGVNVFDLSRSADAPAAPNLSCQDERGGARRKTKTTKFPSAKQANSRPVRAETTG